MVKRHLKRINSPKTWPIARKETVFLIRPKPSGHPMPMSLPLGLLLKDVLGMTGTARASRFLFRTQDVLVNGRKARRLDESAGLMDVVSFPAIKASFRILINSLNKLYTVPVAGDEAKRIPSKVTSKRLQKSGKLQVGCHNGITLLLEKQTCKVGDTLLLSMEKKIEAQYPLAAGAFVLITGGKHVGATGLVAKLANGTITIATADGTIETERRNAFVLGQERPAIKLT